MKLKNANFYFLKLYTTSQIGYLDALPFIVASLFAFVFAHFADWLIITDKLSITHTRKLANHFCLIGTALGYVGLCFVGCSYVWAEIVIILMVTANATSMSGYLVRFPFYGKHYELPIILSCVCHIMS